MKNYIASLLPLALILSLTFTLTPLCVPQQKAMAASSYLSMSEKHGVNGYAWLMHKITAEYDKLLFSYPVASLKFLKEFSEDGKYDLKVSDQYGPYDKRHVVALDGKLYCLDAATLGNILYGYVGSSLFSLPVLTKAGDLLDGMKSISVFERNAILRILSNKDNPEDRAAITAGFTYAQKGVFSFRENKEFLKEHGYLSIGITYKGK